MTPYDPLDKKNLAVSVANELLSQPIRPLPPARFTGAGVYAIYYSGSRMPYAHYAPIATAGLDEQDWIPIYVGKAVPAGARVGGFGLDALRGSALFNRLREHAESIRQAANLDLEDFSCRYLVVDDIWIPLTESILIERFQPLWNTTVAGFGNHTPGRGRYEQQRSAWDELHRGRGWANRLQPHSRTEAELVGLIRRSLAR